MAGRQVWSDASTTCHCCLDLWPVWPACCRALLGGTRRWVSRGMRARLGARLLALVKRLQRRRQVAAVGRPAGLTRGRRPRLAGPRGRGPAERPGARRGGRGARGARGRRARLGGRRAREQRAQQRQRREEGVRAQLQAACAGIGRVGHFSCRGFRYRQGVARMAAQRPSCATRAPGACSAACSAPDAKSRHPLPYHHRHSTVKATSNKH